ncbi:Rft protein-domain-containing protein [Coemansia spiralis]|nr:Rft protein-domain-containing protein [Coemansia spiralis]
MDETNPCVKDSIASRGRSPTVSAFSGAQYLVGLQIFVKLATFFMNIAVIYLAGREAFGVASVKFELVLSTIVFLSREGIRSALLRVDATRNRDSADSNQQIINASLAPIAAGMIMASGLYIFYVSKYTYTGESNSTEPLTSSVLEYRRALTIYIVAACIELCVEPLFVLSRARILFKLRAKCEGIAVAGRCVVIVLLLLLGRVVSEDTGKNPYRLLAFAVGQLAYSIFMLLAFSWYMSTELSFPVWSCYVPRPIYAHTSKMSKAYIDGSTRRLAATFVGQSLLKHFLTQGDNMIMARYASDDVMGVFAFVTNYGSIPARVIFLPLEEASRAVFSRLDGGTSRSSNNNGASSTIDTVDAQIASHVLTTLGKMQLLFGMILAVFGTLYLPILLSLVGMGDVAVVNTSVVYCLYLPFIGLNGFLEAFVHSVATSAQLLRLSIWMAGFSVIYAAFAVQMLHKFNFGSVGVVIANMLNMVLRIGYCWVFISRWFARHPYKTKPKVSAMFPHPVVIGTCLLSGIAVAIMLRVLGHHQKSSPVWQVISLAGGGIMCAVVLASVWRFEKQFLRSVQGLRSGKIAVHSSHSKTE